MLKFAFYVVTIEILFTGHNKRKTVRTGLSGNRRENEMSTELEKYYNKFCEEKRLTRRHGKVEYITSMKYIHKYLEGKEGARILDVGAGTGRYSVQLAEEGYDVTAVELVKYNLGIFKIKGKQCKGLSGDCIESVTVCFQFF